MDLTCFKPIPGYEKYSVTPDGCVKSIERDLIISQYLLNGYYVVDTHRNSRTSTLPVHRAVALAWVDNPKPDVYYMVNHKDGDPLNNRWDNLEWTNHSGNNYHAIDNGLRSDNVSCRIRDVVNGQVREFSSMAQAAEFMGLSKDTPYCMLQPRRFGGLIEDRYELRYVDDPRPWFYEGRKGPIRPSRYMVTVEDGEGVVREYFSSQPLLKDFQLYRSPYGKSMPALVQYGIEQYPNLVFTLRDSFNESEYRVRRNTAPSVRMTIRAESPSGTLEFDSLTRAARHFGRDRVTILKHIEKQKELGGWKLIRLSAHSAKSE